MTKARQERLNGVVIGVLVVLAAIFAEAITIPMFLKARQVAGWPTTVGRVFQSDYDEALHGTVTAKIRYEFYVENKRYESRQVRTRGQSSKHEEDILPLVERFPVGSQPTVYYNPANPSDAYLEAGVTTMNYVIIVIPAVMGAVFCWAAMSDWKAAKRDESNSPS
jgi:hypothetical protein